MPPEYRGYLANMHQEPDDYERRDIRIRAKVDVGAIVRKDVTNEQMIETLLPLLEHSFTDFGPVEKVRVSIEVLDD
jgi:hypothetical protein